MQSLTPKLESWLNQFAEAVRNRDYVVARKLFDKQVVAFGTRQFRAENLDELVADQWRVAWPITRDFAFDFSSAVVLLEGEQAVVAVDWSATGTRRDGGTTACRGRATLVLHNDDSGWKAVHTHYSMLPERNG